MKTGLLFGSFNPIHNGHLVVASYMLENTDIEEVWFVVSPHNPLKDKDGLLSDKKRLSMVELAIQDNGKLKVTDIEFGMSKPSYTYDTLTKLSEVHKDREFIFICGSDLFKSFDKWKNYKKLLNEYDLYVYKRFGFGIGSFKGNIKLFETPYSKISSTLIRDKIKKGEDIENQVPSLVDKYIKDNKLYEQL